MLKKIFSNIFRGKKQQAPTIEQPKNLFAFVLLEQAGLPPAATMIESFRKIGQGHGELSISEDHDTDSAQDPSVIMFQIKGIGSGFFGYIDQPVPDGEAEAYFSHSVSSFSSTAHLPSHQMHIIVMFMPEDGVSPVEAMMTFTDVLATVVETTASVGVYYGNAHVTHTRKFFLTMANEREISPRILLWNGISKARENGNRISILSHGMERIALPDVYLISKQHDVGSLLERAFDLMSYLAQRGSAIPAGDTIGSSAEEKMLVEYVKSPADPEKIVCKIEM